MRVASSLLLALGMLAYTAVPAEPVFRCVTPSRKIIEVRQSDAGNFVYSFGRAQFPEIVFEAPRRPEDVWKWSGIGRDQLYIVRMSNGNTRYEVYWRWDSLTPSDPPEAGVEVYVGEKLISSVPCSKKHNVVQNISELP
jgi:hypothetical protein